MAPKAEITSWADDTTGKKYVQIQGKIYEELAPARPGRHSPAPGDFGWGDVPDDQGTADGWQAAGAERGKRWQRAHTLQEKQLCGRCKAPQAVHVKLMHPDNTRMNPESPPQTSNRSKTGRPQV